MPTDPLAGDVHVSTPLTNFGQKYLQSENSFVSLRAMPNIPVAKQADLYYEFNKGDFWRVEDTARADGTESKGGSFTTSTNPYFADVHAWHKDVTDRQRTNADSQISLDQSAAQYVNQILMISREIAFAATFMTPASWTTNINKDWTAASSDPEADVKVGARTIQGLTGMRPNKMICGRQAWDTITGNDAIRSTITGGSTSQNPAKIRKELVAALFEVEEIFVMDAVKNTAIKGAADAITFIVAILRAKHCIR